MIRYVKGTLVTAEEDSVIVETGGIGYRVRVSAMTLSSLPRTGNTVQLYTYLQVREDAFSLFGFLTQEELSLFECLIGVSGVGPKAALSILGVLSANDLKFAVLSGDAKAISRAPGIGAKTAQRVVMELKDRVSLDEAFEERSAGVLSGGAASAAADDAILALTALGYSAQEAAHAVKSIPDAEAYDTEALLKQALKVLF